MRSLVAALTILGLVLGLALPAAAGWVWRDGRWIYAEPSEPAPPAPRTPQPPAPKPPESASPSESAPPAAKPPAPAPSQPSQPKSAVPAPTERVAPGPQAPSSPVIAQPVSPPQSPETPATPAAHAPVPVVRTPATPSAPAGAIRAPAPGAAAESGFEPPAPVPARPAPMPIPRATVQPPAPLADEPAPAAPENSSARTPWWRWWERTDDGSADRTLFAQGMAAYEQGSLGTAIRRLKKLIKDHPTSRYREEAIWRAADAYFQQKEYYKAYEQYENLLTQYAGSAYYRDGLLREIEIADLFLGPVRRRVLGVPLLSGETEAIEILRRVYEHQPAGDLADDVVLKIADYYWAKSRWPESEDYYDKYCREYPNGESVLYAELQRAKCTIERCRGPLYDTTCLQLAYDRLQAFQQKYPNEGWQQGVPELMLAVRDTQAEAMYRIAERYLRGGEPLAAAFYAERLRGKFADSPWSDRAAAFLIDAPLTQEPNP